MIELSFRKGLLEFTLQKKQTIQTTFIQNKSEIFAVFKIKRSMKKVLEFISGSNFLILVILILLGKANPASLCAIAAALLISIKMEHLMKFAHSLEFRKFVLLCIVIIFSLCVFIYLLLTHSLEVAHFLSLLKSK